MSRLAVRWHMSSQGTYCDGATWGTPWNNDRACDWAGTGAFSSWGSGGKPRARLTMKRISWKRVGIRKQNLSANHVFLHAEVSPRRSSKSSTKEGDELVRDAGGLGATTGGAGSFARVGRTGEPCSSLSSSDKPGAARSSTKSSCSESMPSESDSDSGEGDAKRVGEGAAGRDTSPPMFSLIRWIAAHSVVERPRGGLTCLGPGPRLDWEGLVDCNTEALGCGLAAGPGRSLGGWGWPGNV